MGAVFGQRLDDDGALKPAQAESLAEAVHRAHASKQDLGEMRQGVALLRGDVIAVLAGIEYFG